MTDFNPRFVTAVNAKGRKQKIPRHWLGHPVLGRGFKLPPSASRETPRSRVGETPTQDPGGNPSPAKTPAAGD